MAHKKTFLETFVTGWKAYILLALITLGASLPGVIMVPALDRDESRFAQASKQMLETGDYIEVRYQDEARNKKPAGIHWLQAGATAAVSNSQAGQIWSYRLPSLLGALLATLGTFWCGQVLIGRRGAFLGAAMFGAGLLLTSEAHIAKTDAVLTGLTVIAMGALARAYRALHDGEPARTAPGLMFVFWCLLGVSFLIKGPVTLLVAALTIGFVCLVQRDLSLGQWALDGRGFLLFALIVLPWFIWVQVATEGAFLDGAIGKDLKDKFAGASEGHGGPPGYHLAFLAVMFFPGTIYLLPSFMLLIRTLRGKALDVLTAERTGLLFLVAWALPTWVFFEILPTKLPHYILPAYPALGLICGWGLVQMMGGARATVSRFLSLGLFTLGGLAFCFLISPWGADLMQSAAAANFRHAATEREVLVAWSALPEMPAHMLLASVLALLGATGFSLARRYGTGLMLAIAASIMAGWHVRTVFLPGVTWMQPTVTARAALADVCGLKSERAPVLYGKNCQPPFPDIVQAVGYAEPSLVFTTGTNTVIPPKTRIVLPESRADYPVVWLLNLEDEAGQAARERLETLARENNRCMRDSNILYALNYSNGDPVAFLARRIEANPCQT